MHENKQKHATAKFQKGNVQTSLVK